MPQIEHVVSDANLSITADDVDDDNRSSTLGTHQDKVTAIRRSSPEGGSKFIPTKAKTMAGHTVRTSSKINLGTFSFYFILLLTQICATSACPTLCTCDGTTVDCTHQSLSSLPSGIPPETTNLDLRNNRIETLTADMFTGLSNVQYLYLDSLQVATVEAGAFNGLDALTDLSMKTNLLTALPDNAFSAVAATLIKLSLTGNQIATFSDAAFAGLTALETLELTGNQLATLPANGFSDLSSVTSLDLRNNLLTTIPADAFQGLTSLPVLSLDSNDITSMDAGVLSPMTALRKFTAVGNDLTTIPPGVFASHATLEEIDLQDNQIGNIDTSMFSALDNIKVIKLRSNRIASIGGYPHAFVAIKATLEDIDLSNNLLTELVMFNFLGLPKLTTLDLSENQIASISLNSFLGDEDLTTINLQHNLISALPANGLALGSLITVDLSHNLLTAVPSDAFSAASLVEDLYLNDNQLTAVEANAFETCPYIRVINLKRNEIATMAALSFSELEQLRTVDLSFNNLTTLVAETFIDLRRLTEVDMASNTLEMIEADAFKNLPAVEQLDFRNNVIHTVEDGSFVGVTSLTALYFQHNQLTAVPKGAVESVTTLVTLDFSYNLINALTESKSFGDLVNLQTLYLHENAVGTLASDCLAGLDALNNVTLSSNSLTSITSPLSSTTQLTALISISFRDNSITSVASDAFVGFLSLQTVDFKGNSLTTLTSAVVEPFKSTVSDLRLGGNDWSCDCDLQWLVDDFAAVISEGSCATPAALVNRSLAGGDITSEEICATVTTTIATTVPVTTQPPTTTTTQAPTTITEPVVIQTPSQEINAKSGENVNLPCVATGIPAPTITWSTAAGSVITASGSYSIDSSTGTLTISSITDAFVGYYICTASNVLGSQASIDIRIVVHFPPYITNFIEASVIADTVDCYSLPCDVNAYPPASFSWIVPDGALVDDPVTGSIIMTSTGTVYFSEPDSESTGYYNCTAENTEGSVSAESFVFVYNATETATPVSISADEGDTVELPGSAIYSSSGFAWALPSGSFIITSVMLVDEYSTQTDVTSGPETSTVTTMASVTGMNQSPTVTTSQSTTDSETLATGTSSTQPTSATQSSATSESQTMQLVTAYKLSSGALVYTDSDISSIYSVVLSDGTLRISTVTALLSGSSVGVTSGTYTLYTARGTLTYNVVTGSSTTSNDTTVIAVTASPVTDTSALSQVTIYYICLGSFLFFIISTFLLCLILFRGKKGKKATYKSDLSRSTVTIKEP